MRFLIQIILLLLMHQIPLFSEKYYVATNGDNSNAGTNWATAWSNIAYAAQQVSAGDAVYVADGTYIEQVTMFSNGTPANPIIFQATNRAIVNGTNGFLYGFYIPGRRNIIIKNFICKNATQAGIRLLQSTNIQLTNNICYSNTTAGIMLGGANLRNTVFSNILYNNNSRGILLSSDYSNLIAENKIYGNQRGINMDNSSAGNFIYKNEIYSNQIGVALFGIGPMVPQNNIIQSNYIHHNLSFPQSGISFNNADYNIIIGNRIEFNGMLFAGGRGISIENGSAGNLIYNNTIFSNVGDGLCLSDMNTVSNAISDNYIMGNASSGFPTAGILIVDADNNFITNNNRIHRNNSQGIYIQGNFSGANWNIFRNNRISSNAMDGIYLESFFPAVRSNQMISNLIFGNGSGIGLQGMAVQNSLISGNIIYNNVFGMGIGVSIWDSGKNLVIHNRIYRNFRGIQAQNSASSNIVNNNQVFSNNGEGIDFMGFGGMIHNVISSNLVYANMMTGINCMSAAGTTILRNNVWRNMTGVNVNDSSPVISYNWIGTNQQQAIWLANNSHATLTYNTIVSNNTTGFAAEAVYIDGSNPMVNHNTIDKNKGDALNLVNNAAPIIKNNIISSNQNWGINNAGGGVPSVTYNDIIGNGTGELLNCNNTNNNIYLPPQYVGGEDYHLQVTSPCIGTAEDYDDQGAWPYGFDLVVLKGENCPPDANISPDTFNIPVLQFKLIARNNKTVQVTNIIVTVAGSSTLGLHLEVTNVVLVEDVDQDGQYGVGDNVLDANSDFGAGTNASLSCNININPGSPVYFLILFDFNLAVQGETYIANIRGENISALTNGVPVIPRKFAPGNTNTITGGIDYFVINHDGKGLRTVLEKFTVTARDSLDLTIETYTGTITIYAIEGTPADTSWSNITGTGLFTDLGNGRAVYNFVLADRGIITLGIIDNTAETVDLEVISQITAKTDTDNEGLLVIYPEPVHNITQAKDYVTIQSALDEANSGDTIRCDEWVYYENITITSNVSLEATDWVSSRDSTKAVIDGSGGVPGSSTVWMVPWHDTVNIRGFTILNGDNMCVYCTTGCGGELKGNIIKYAGNQGIYCSTSSTESIISNTIKSNGNYGIFVWSSAIVHIEGNRFSDNSYGIGLVQSSGNVVTNNWINNNRLYGIYIRANSANNMIINNSIESNQKAGIFSETCNNNFIYNNLIANNTASTGIYFESSSGIIKLNTITNNSIGINLSGGSLPIISKNNIFNNTGPFDLFNNQANPVDALTNWWGTSILTNIDKRIRDDEEGGGAVAFIPFRLFTRFDIFPGADTDSLPIITSFTAAVTNNSVDLRWNSVGGADFSHYNIYRSTVPGITNLFHYPGIYGSVIAYTTNTNYTDTPGEYTWYYYITASDDYPIYTNECWYSAEASVYIAPYIPKLKIAKSIENITLDAAAIDPIPGATVAYEIFYSNASLITASNARIYDRISSFVTYRTSQTLPSWTVEWSTNNTPDQSYNSSNYQTNLPGLDRIKWISWKSPLIAGEESDNLYYEVIIK